MNQPGLRNQEVWLHCLRHADLSNATVSLGIHGKITQFIALTLLFFYSNKLLTIKEQDIMTNNFYNYFKNKTTLNAFSH